jgi:uncharacterized membrane protein YqiK
MPMQTIFIVAVLAVLVLLFIVSSFAQMYRKVGPNEALIVYGWRGPRVVKGGGTFIMPMFENYRQLSLELMSFDVAPQQDLYTRQGRCGHSGGRRADQGEIGSRIRAHRGRAVSYQTRQ